MRLAAFFLLAMLMAGTMACGARRPAPHAEPPVRAGWVDSAGALRGEWVGFAIDNDTRTFVRSTFERDASPRLGELDGRIVDGIFRGRALDRQTNRRVSVWLAPQVPLHPEAMPGLAGPYEFDPASTSFLDRLDTRGGWFFHDNHYGRLERVGPELTFVWAGGRVLQFVRDLDGTIKQVRLVEHEADPEFVTGLRLGAYEPGALRVGRRDIPTLLQPPHIEDRPVALVLSDPTAGVLSHHLARLGFHVMTLPESSSRSLMRGILRAAERDARFDASQVLIVASSEQIDAALALARAFPDTVRGVQIIGAPILPPERGELRRASIPVLVMEHGETDILPTDPEALMVIERLGGTDARFVTRELSSDLREYHPRLFLALRDRWGAVFFAEEDEEEVP